VYLCVSCGSEKKPIISLYSINWLVCITDAVCVYYAVRTESSYIIQVSRQQRQISYCIKKVMFLVFLTVPLRRDAIRQEFYCYCEVTAKFKRSHHADVIREGNVIIIVTFTAHNYWDHGTLLRSMQVPEIMAHYWDQCTLLRLLYITRSWHVTEINASYWNCGTLLRS
jgi:hypothetical protein